MIGPDGKVIFARYKPGPRDESEAVRIERRAIAAGRVCAQRYAALQTELQLVALKEHVVRITKRLASGQFEAAMRDAQRSLQALRSLNRSLFVPKEPINLPATLESLKAKFNS